MGDRGWLDDGAWVAEEAPIAGAAAAAGGDAGGRGRAGGAAATGDVAGMAAEESDAPIGGSGGPGVGLTAGSTDDNQRWDDYLRYRREFAALGVEVRDVDVSERHVLHVRDRTGAPILGARVQLHQAGGSGSLAEVRTYADGRALLFPRALRAANSMLRLTVTPPDGSRQSAVEMQLERDTFDHEITLGGEAPGLTKLDVVFLLNATGSMGDEIDRLKRHMTTVAERIAGRDDEIDVRFGLTAYRDRGDAFVTRTFDLTDDVAAFTTALGEVRPGGGGDTPEALSAGLRAALAKPAWRGDDTVKLLCLVADAPPQMDDPEGADYSVEVVKAAAAGAKIHPIASSGLDDRGEYVYRQLAQITMGRFVFLTYGADGDPGDVTTHHVDKYAGCRWTR